MAAAIGPKIPIDTIDTNVKRLILANLEFDDLKNLYLNRAWQGMMVNPLTWQVIAKKQNIAILNAANTKEEVVTALNYKRVATLEALRFFSNETGRSAVEITFKEIDVKEAHESIKKLLHEPITSVLQSTRHLRFVDLLEKIVGNSQESGQEQEQQRNVDIETALQLIDDGILDYINPGHILTFALGRDIEDEILAGNERIITAIVEDFLLQFDMLDNKSTKGKLPRFHELGMDVSEDPRARILSMLNGALEDEVILGAPRAKFTEILLKAGARPYSYGPFSAAILTVGDGNDPNATQLKLLLKYSPEIDRGEVMQYIKEAEDAGDLAADQAQMLLSVVTTPPSPEAAAKTAAAPSPPVAAAGPAATTAQMHEISKKDEKSKG